jgi:catechol 2,3-dioxygenase
MSDPKPIDPRVRIGHVHLKVADLERAIAFYHGVLGFEITQRWGTEAAFLSAGAPGTQLDPSSCNPLQVVGPPVIAPVIPTLVGTGS